MSRSISIVISILVYLIAIIVVAFSIRYFSSLPVLARIAIADLIGTVIIFMFSVIFNNSSMYDPYWSVKPLVIAAYFFSMEPFSTASSMELIVFGLIVLYAARLTANFYRGWSGIQHEDWRYRNFRQKFPKLYWIVSFFGIHLFPTIMVYLGCLPMIVIFNEPVQMSIVAVVGALLLLGSVILAFIADEQLRKYRRNSANEGKTMNLGLWSGSRHPNYLGEILSWWGLFILALASGWQYWWTGVGALVITLMFVFISIPMMEKHALNRRKDYRQYKEKTPFLLPFKF